MAMPIYEYECASCGHTDEFFMKISDPAPSTCKCGVNGKLKKKISQTHFRLKGQGWYETDFKTKSGKEGKIEHTGSDKKNSGNTKPSNSKKSNIKEEKSSAPTKSPAKNTA